MNCRCGLSVEEVHQISFLTVHGWALSDGLWEKQGFERLIVGRWGEHETMTRFELESAYYAQMEAAGG